jgi:hypothetical protein
LADHPAVGLGSEGVSADELEPTGKKLTTLRWASTSTRLLAVAEHRGVACNNTRCRSERAGRRTDTIERMRDESASVERSGRPALAQARSTAKGARLGELPDAAVAEVGDDRGHDDP